MNNKVAAVISGVLLALFAFMPPAMAQEVDGEHVDAELLAETTAAVPGDILWTAVRLEHSENWHTYWINPGDAGKPTEISWQLPEGVTAGEIVWPTPERFELPADLVDFGYTGEIFLLVPLTIPADFSAATLTATASVAWLECEDVCIPSGADLNLTVPVTTQAPAPLNEPWQYGFAATRASQPRADITLDASFSINNGAIELLVQATENIFENARTITFIPDQHRILDYNAEQQLTTQLSSLQLRQNYNRRVEREAPARVGGLLLVTGADGQQLAYQVEAEPAGVNTSQLGGVMAATNNLDVGSGTNSDMALGTVFLFAMLGGIILNLMPCVFPVLSLKVMSLSAHSNYSQQQQRMHGLSYTAGVISAFLALAGVLLSLQASGSAIGWGFHLQTPWFVGALVFLFFVMGLSMSGVVEFGAGVMGIGTNLQEKEGYTGSFFTGVLASVVASPCTAPFMGAALGFAFTQTMAVALTVFVALGFGMALPFLLISFVPGLAARMPRPGHWMVTFKQILAFPLYATAAWLLWVLGQQTSSDAMAMVIGACVLLAFASWLYNRRHTTRGAWRYVSALLILVSLFTSFSVLRSPFLEARSLSTTVAEDSSYQAYSDALLADLRAQGKPVFVNMTASWCITCLVNEKVALSGDSFITALKEKDVTYLKGDWTNNDPAITAVLKQYETSGVPLYLMFPADASKPAEVLPQILTEGIVLDALARI